MFSQCAINSSWMTLNHNMHFKQLAAAPMAVFGQKSAPPVYVLGNPRTGGVQSCSLYCGKELVLKDKGSMNLVTFVAQEWPLTTAVQSEKQCPGVWGWGWCLVTLVRISPSLLRVLLFGSVLCSSVQGVHLGSQGLRFFLFPFRLPPYPKP